MDSSHSGDSMEVGNSQRNIFSDPLDVLKQHIVPEILCLLDGRVMVRATQEVEDAASRVNAVMSSPFNADTPRIVLVTSPQERDSASFAQKVSIVGQQNGLLAAVLSYRRPIDGEVAKKILSTMAYQYAVLHPDKEGSMTIKRLIAERRSILNEPPSIQLEDLILKPLSSASVDATMPLSIVINGLDATTPKELQDCILRMLCIPGLRFVITSQLTLPFWLQDGLEDHPDEMKTIDMTPGGSLRKLYHEFVGLLRNSAGSKPPWFIEPVESKMATKISRIYQE